MQASSQRPLSSQGPAPTAPLPAASSTHLFSSGQRTDPTPCPPLPQGHQLPQEGRVCVGWGGGWGLSPTSRASRVGAMSPRAAAPPPASARPHQAYQAQVEAGSTSPSVAGSRVGRGWGPAALAHPESAPDSTQPHHFPAAFALGGAPTVSRFRVTAGDPGWGLHHPPQLCPSEQATKCPPLPDKKHS